MNKTGRKTISKRKNRTNSVHESLSIFINIRDVVILHEIYYNVCHIIEAIFPWIRFVELTKITRGGHGETEKEEREWLAIRLFCNKFFRLFALGFFFFKNFKFDLYKSHSNRQVTLVSTTGKRIFCTVPNTRARGKKHWRAICIDRNGHFWESRSCSNFSFVDLTFS